MESGKSQSALNPYPSDKPAARPRSPDGKIRLIAAAACAVIVLVAAGVIYFLLSGPRGSGSETYAVQTDLDTADDAADAGPAPEVGTQLDTPPGELQARLAARLAALPKIVQARADLLEDPALRRQMRSGAKGEAAPAEALGPPRRWEIHFIKGNTIENYAKQLDFFGVELGALMPDNKIIYAYNLSKLKPDTRIGPVENESRYYLSWARGDLIDADRELFTAAGFETKDRVILRFLPSAIESAIATLEKSYAGDKAGKIEKTRFALRRKGEGYEIYVMEQTYQQPS